ncbi:MAG: hypothetical protein V3R99_08250 [Thermoguttaceae bacterium]
MRLRHLITTISLAAAMLFGSSRVQAAELTVTILTDKSPGLGTTHGLGKVTTALQAKGVDVRRVATPKAEKGNILIVAGLGDGSGHAARLLKATDTVLPEGPEALAIKNTTLDGKRTLLVAGSDDRGLMYALLDVADRTGWSTDANDPLSEVRDTTEKPFMPERALSIYTMHRKTFEKFFFDEEYWAEYLDMLAENRFNTFALLLGYENWGYFAPPYPFFFDVEGYSDIRVEGLTAEQQQRNLKALNRVIEMTHERGLDFTLGIWDHIYRGGVQGPTEHAKQRTPGVVWGLTADKLVPYTKAALTKLLREVPDLDAIQFRMHGESGLRRSEMEDFWTDVYRIMKASGGDIRFDARAKNFPDSLIDRALEVGVPIRICTKYWMEQMGMPFHPTHVHPANQHDRRHGYADMLRYPKRYDMHWRLWSGGTTRVLLWGDPEYVRRFAQSTLIYPGGGYEVTAPMATKMQDHPHDLEPFELLRPKYQYYDWEFQRYWHFFQCFGRMGYNPDTPPEVWQKEFERRFGKEAAPYVEKALHRASQILPRIVAYQYPYNHFPTTRGWAERQRQEDLPTYAKALPSDTEQFLSPDEAAKNMIEGIDSAKILPRESSRWFAGASRDVLGLVEKAEKYIGKHRNKEFDSTMVDMKILAHLAAYHSRRANAGTSWALFNRSEDVGSLDSAIYSEGRAIEAWKRMVEAAGDMYHDDIMMGRRGSDLSGHWRDELVKLENGLEKLRQQRDSFRPKSTGDGPMIAHVPDRTIRRHARTPRGIVSRIEATVSGERPIAQVRFVYRIGRGEWQYKKIRTSPNKPFVYRALVPNSMEDEGLSYFIEAVDESGARTTFPAAGADDPIVVDVTRDGSAPMVTHTAIKTAPAEKPLRVVATVDDPSGVKWVRLRYRSVSQYEDYKTLDMRPTDKPHEYAAVVPGEHIPSQWDFMYFIEVMDNHGNGQIYPDLEKTMPYVVVKLEREGD